MWEGVIPMALARNISLEKLKQVWEPKSLGQRISCFWSLHAVWDPLGQQGCSSRDVAWRVRGGCCIHP